MNQPDLTSNPPGTIVATGSGGSPDTRGRRLEAIAGVTDQMVQRFSRPASQLTGRFISLFGLMLIVAALVLATVHLLGAADFIAATIAGALLSIAGVLTLMTDYVSAQRAALLDLARIGAEAQRAAEARRLRNG